jgi:hypothetical protein
MAAMIATYSYKALAVLDAPLDRILEKRSWYDCETTMEVKDIAETISVPGNDSKPPIVEGHGRAQRRTKGRKKSLDYNERTPALRNGLNSLIQHPQWLSHGCPVPCQSSYDYSKWNDVRDTSIQWDQQLQQQQHQITCHNDNDRQATVLVVGLDDVARHFEQMWNEQMSIRPAYDHSHQWAIQLGAKGHEAHQFAVLENGDDIWDYATSLMVQSGIVQFQPSFAKDIKS